MELLKNVNVRPAHYTYVVNDRKPAAYFFRVVLGMKVLRHIEVISPQEKDCPRAFEGRSSRTFFGFGPEASYYAIQIVYYYRDVGAFLGNCVKCLKVHSLRAIARCKAVGLPLTEVDGYSFDFVSPNGCTIRLVDDDHRRCDPCFEVCCRTNKLTETEHFWSQVMGIGIISKTEEEILLFFGNHKLQIRYEKVDVKIEHSEFVRFSFTIPFQHLINLSNSIPEEHVVTPLQRRTVPERESDFELLLKDPNGYKMMFHDLESWLKLVKPDRRASTRLDLAVHTQARKREQLNSVRPPT